MNPCVLACFHTHSKSHAYRSYLWDLYILFMWFQLLVPAAQTVFSWRYAIDVKLAVQIGAGEIGVLYHHDVSRHFQVDITEQLHHARFVEFHSTEHAALVEPEIESFSLGNRKHVVGERVAVREFHCGACLDYQHVRNECQVFLIHYGRFLRSRERAFDVFHGDHEVGQIRRRGQRSHVAFDGSGPSKSPNQQSPPNARDKLPSR